MDQEDLDALGRLFFAVIIFVAVIIYALRVYRVL